MIPGGLLVTDPLPLPLLFTWRVDEVGGEVVNTAVQDLFASISIVPSLQSGSPAQNLKYHPPSGLGIRVTLPPLE